MLSRPVAYEQLEKLIDLIDNPTDENLSILDIGMTALGRLDFHDDLKFNQGICTLHIFSHLNKFPNLQRVSGISHYLTERNDKTQLLLFNILSIFIKNAPDRAINTIHIPRTVNFEHCKILLEEIKQRGNSVKCISFSDQYSPADNWNNELSAYFLNYLKLNRNITSVKFYNNSNFTTIHSLKLVHDVIFDADSTVNSIDLFNTALSEKRSELIGRACKYNGITIFLNKYNGKNYSYIGFFENIGQEKIKILNNLIDNINEAAQPFTISDTLSEMARKFYMKVVYRDMAVGYDVSAEVFYNESCINIFKLIDEREKEYDATLKDCINIKPIRSLILAYSSSFFREAKKDNNHVPIHLAPAIGTEAISSHKP